MIVSVHHYELAASASDDDFLEAVAEARRRDLFDLPGIVVYRFLLGIRGGRTDSFAAVWTYESREAWRTLWGPVGDPVPREAYPDGWIEWEEDLPAPILAGDPDDVEDTAYEVVESSAGEHDRGARN